MKTIKQLVLALLLAYTTVFADTQATDEAPLGTPVTTQATEKVENTEKTDKAPKKDKTGENDDNEEDEEEEEENDPLKQEIKRLKLKNAKLSLENAIRSAQHDKGLQGFLEERESLEVELQLNLTRLKKELAALEAEREKLNLQNELRTAKEMQDTAAMRNTLSRMDLEYTINERRQVMETAEIDEIYYKLSRENALAAEKHKAKTLKLRLQTAQLNFELLKVKHKQSKRDDELDLMQYKINRQYLQEALKERAEHTQNYLHDPVVDGYLIVSDRKIDLGGIILRGTAEYISERIHFFNNQSEEYPIFLVISESPGGSVMEGMKILKAMEASRAPIYVVVKSLAASMAATITTLADKSFALPDAVILHHQVSGQVGGTVTQLEEQLKTAKEWSQRLLTPVAKKMGLPLDAFIKAMYENNSTGDWQTFTDEAVQLKWVDHMIKGIRDTSYLQRPDKDEQQPWMFFAKAEQTDAQGQRYMQLPRLMPFDVYHIYNPDNYYR